MFIKRFVVIYAIIILPIIFVSFLLLITGRVTIQYQGFGIDSGNVLYIGKHNVIEKSVSGEVVANINPLTSRGYVFTVQQNDTILLSDASIAYTLDLNGKIICKEEDYGTKTFNKLQRIKSFATKDGKVYYIKSKLGRTRVVSDDGFVIFNMPILDYCVKISLFIIAVSIPIIVSLAFIYRHRRKLHNTGDGSLS